MGLVYRWQGRLLHRWGRAEGGWTPPPEKEWRCDSTQDRLWQTLLFFLCVYLVISITNHTYHKSWDHPWGLIKQTQKQKDTATKVTDLKFKWINYDDKLNKERERDGNLSWAWRLCYTAEWLWEWAPQPLYLDARRLGDSPHTHSIAPPNPAQNQSYG